ncbi:MAG: hypothetical protein KKB70_08385 [Proteobacteria bacterium]|nr:hypothetical protein [Pseudomonadota bacterium]
MAVLGKQFTPCQTAPIKRVLDQPANDGLHHDLVGRAAKWLKNNGYKVVLTEINSMSSERPDALGFNSEFSCLIECKTSRTDFLADAKKYFRRRPQEGMGALRYYLAPAGIITTEDLPEKWGLLEVRGSKVFKIVEAEMFDRPAAAMAEHPVVFSLLRRLECADPDLLDMGLEVASVSLRVQNARRLLKIEEDKLRKRLIRLEHQEKQLGEREKELKRP